MKDSALTKHTYDIDMIETIQLLKMELETSTTLSNQLTADEFVDEIKNSLKLYCKHNRLDFDYHYDHHMMVVIPSSVPYYVYALGITLMVYETTKIQAFLDYQFRAYEGYEDIPNISFVDLLEQTVYHIVKNNSPFENSKRLQEISGWIEIQKNRTKDKSSIHRDERS